MGFKSCPIEETLRLVKRPARLAAFILPTSSTLRRRRGRRIMRGHQIHFILLVEGIEFQKGSSRCTSVRNVARQSATQESAESFVSQSYTGRMSNKLVDSLDIACCGNWIK